MGTRKLAWSIAVAFLGLAGSGVGITLFASRAEAQLGVAVLEGGSATCVPEGFLECVPGDACDAREATYCARVGDGDRHLCLPIGRPLCPITPEGCPLLEGQEATPVPVPGTIPVVTICLYPRDREALCLPGAEDSTRLEDWRTLRNCFQWEGSFVPYAMGDCDLDRVTNHDDLCCTPLSEDGTSSSTVVDPATGCALGMTARTGDGLFCQGMELSSCSPTMGCTNPAYPSCECVARTDATGTDCPAMACLPATSREPYCVRVRPDAAAVPEMACPPRDEMLAHAYSVTREDGATFVVCIYRDQLPDCLGTPGSDVDMDDPLDCYRDADGAWVTFADGDCDGDGVLNSADRCDCNRQADNCTNGCPATISPTSCEVDEDAGIEPGFDAGPPSDAGRRGYAGGGLGSCAVSGQGAGQGAGQDALWLFLGLCVGLCAGARRRRRRRR